EFRALRMEPTPARMTAVAALLRALAARFAIAPSGAGEPLVHWGTALHDRFALPCFLDEDLRAVLADLDAHGVGLGPAITAARLATRWRSAGSAVARRSPSRSMAGSPAAAATTGCPPTSARRSGGAASASWSTTIRRPGPASRSPAPHRSSRSVSP